VNGTPNNGTDSELKKAAMSELATIASADSPATNGASVLELRALTGGYGRSIVLRDVDLSVPAGNVVALLGPNGAGKTTLLRAAAGLLGVASGQVLLHGRDVTKQKPYERNGHGLCLIPEGRGIFPNLTVRENLRLQIPPSRKDGTVEPALEAFPILKERLGQSAGSMSGGQQQMLALSRCFLADPKVVLLDEVSIGLAPRIIDEIFVALDKLAKAGVSLLLVEQYVSRALKAADHIYLLDRGQITFSGSPNEIDEDELTRRYLGEHRPTPDVEPG
jgi:branched-chain amino acid transport system ATP-binding protein